MKTIICNGREFAHDDIERVLLVDGIQAKGNKEYQVVKLELVNKLNYPYGIEVFKEFLIDGKAPKAEKIFNDISKQIQDANLK